MISVDTVESRSTGERSEPAESVDREDAESSAPESQDTEEQADLLISFLNDYHAAGREPPAPKPAPGQLDLTASQVLPSRFDAFAPVAPQDFDDSDPLPAAVLPVWPPPGSEEALATSALPPKQPVRRRFGRRG